MYISHKLLTSYVNEFKNITYKELNEACINIGCEIEQVISHPKLNNLVVGQIVDIKNIEKSDHLHLVDVLIDKKTIKHIVCGASNLFKNQKVVVALAGSKLYDGRVIENKKLLGVYSEGMLCGYSELTPHFHELLSEDDAKGTITLDDETKVGDKNISELLGLDDTIYELSLPSNRYDWSGALFIIKDLANYFNYVFDINAVLNKVKTNSLKTNIITKICNEARIICLDNVSNKQSLWVNKKILLNNGIKINSETLDFISYLTYLTGIAPLLINSHHELKEIKQQYAIAKDKITIDNKEVKLLNSDVIYKNANDIVALDGVSVSDKYAICNKCKQIYLIVDNLKYSIPRISSINHNLSTLNTKFSVKKITVYQINLFINLLAQKYQISVSKNHSNDEKDRKIKFDINECVRFSSIPSVEIVKKILKQLNLKLVNKEIIVPGYRLDLMDQFDIFEEVLKVYGINNIKDEPIYTALDADTDIKDEYFYINRIRNLLVENYFSEAKTYNLTSDNSLDSFNLFNLKPMYHINPCSNLAHEYMRLGLTNELVKVMQYNANRKNELIPIFEIQKIYNKDFALNLTCLTPQRVIIDSINDSQLIFNTFGLKGIVNLIAASFYTLFKYKKAKNKYLYDNDCLEIYHQNKLIGLIGCIKDNLLKPYKISQPLYLLSINLNSLIDKFNPNVYKVKKLEKLSPVIKDLTFNATSQTNIESIIDNLNKLSYLNSWSFTKAYHLNDNEIAYTIHLSLSNNDKVLTKDDIKKYLDEIVSFIKAAKAEVKGM